MWADEQSGTNVGTCSMKGSMNSHLPNLVIRCVIIYDTTTTILVISRSLRLITPYSSHVAEVWPQKTGFDCSQYSWRYIHVPYAITVNEGEIGYLAA